MKQRHGRHGNALCWCR